MKVQRFFAVTTREALAQVREALGPDAIILSNRNINDGVEILASHERDFSFAVEQSQQDAPPPPKKTKPLITNTEPEPEQQPKSKSKSKSKPDPEPDTTAPNQDVTNDLKLIIDEIRGMRGSLETKLSTLTLNEEQPPNSAKVGIVRELIAMGFSAKLSRYMAENAPEDQDIELVLSWAKGIFERNLSTIKNDAEILDSGGIYALVGPTGVGKTTTTAKLAARYVMRHGASKLALITTDNYRIGAHEQLRIYGDILGVMVHSVSNETDLSITLDKLKTKHTILIDTVGMGQRDKMVSEQITMLSGTETPIKHLLCLNTTSTIETLNEVVAAYRGSNLAGCILTKLDEAVTLSNALEVVLRQKLKLFYFGTGQRVPEDLHLVKAGILVDHAFKYRHSNSANRLEDDELANLMASTTPYNSDLKSIYVE